MEMGNSMGDPLHYRVSQMKEPWETCATSQFSLDITPTIVAFCKMESKV
jgi:hypothetical protein